MLSAEDKEMMRDELEREAEYQHTHDYPGLDSFDSFIFAACTVVAVLIAFIVVSIAAVQSDRYYRTHFEKQNPKEITHARIRPTDKENLEVLKD